MSLLVLNAGSSSVKFMLFGADDAVLLAGAVTEIGGAARLACADRSGPVAAPDHAVAIAAILAALAGAGHPPVSLTACAHRVVHGGARLTAPTRLTPAVIAEIAACVPLAPLHNPANLAGIRAMQAAAPDLPQTASFDTAFHATNPPEATAYAIPARHRDAGIRRYGFHGISYASLTERLPAIAGHLPPRLLALHLGNGASLCAIADGRSVATTMGYSPLSGLTMGTRAGDIDGNAVLALARSEGIDATARILNHDSGLKAIGGASDMRALDARGFARTHFAYWAARHAGSMIAAMGGLDAIAFTGGIGENDAAMRADIMDRLAFTGLLPDRTASGPALHASDSLVTAWIVPAAEEARIAADARQALDQSPDEDY